MDDGQFTFTIAVNIDEIRALISYHECQQEEADSVGLDIEGDRLRANYLRTLIEGEQQ